MLDLSSAISVLLGAITLLFTRRGTRAAEKSLKISQATEINAAVVRGRLSSDTRQNIFLIYRNDGQVPSYSINCKFHAGWMGEMCHIIPVLEPNETYHFKLPDGANLQEFHTDVSRNGIKIRRNAHLGESFTEVIFPIPIGMATSDHELRIEKGHILPTNRIPLGLETDVR